MIFARVSILRHMFGWRNGNVTDPDGRQRNAIADAKAQARSEQQQQAQMLEAAKVVPGGIRDLAQANAMLQGQGAGG